MVTKETESGMDQALPNQETAADTIRSPEQNARLIAIIFVHHFGLFAGETLTAVKLSGAWYEKHKGQTDLVEGLEYAKAKRWIYSVDEAFTLTEAGYQVGHEAE